VRITAKRLKAQLGNIIFEQVRRLTMPTTSGDSGVDRDELMRDLQQLQATSNPESKLAAMAEHN